MTTALLTTPNYQNPIRANMHFPQILHRPVTNEQIIDVEQLAQHQIGKYRRYIQLQSGDLQGQLNEVRLDGVVIAREKLNVAMQIYAQPPQDIVPIAALLSNTEGMKFCNSQFNYNDLIQASGSEWQLYTKHNIDYITTIMLRKQLEYHTQILTGETTQKHWFNSLAKPTDPGALYQYKHWLVNLLMLLQNQTELLNRQNIRRQLSGQVFSLAIKLLATSNKTSIPIERRSRRLAGVKKVIEYLDSYAIELPSISDLCVVACLSERSLEYGFKEHFNLTPHRYAKLIRLNRVRQELYLADNQYHQVTDVALKWGFFELGRFAAEYKQLFHELPSQTLRR